MPVMTKKVGRKYRVVESATGKIARNKAGTAIDGGGYSSRDEARSQVSAVNLAMRRRGRRHG